MSGATLKLKKGAERRIKSGHQWVYSNEVDTAATPLSAFSAGDQVALAQSNGKVLGTLMINPNCLIVGRLISRKAGQMLTASLLKKRLARALALRESVFPKPYYRLVFGDSDGLSGLVIDRFGDLCVVQISTAGMEALKPQILKALQSVVSGADVVFKNDGKMREVEGLPSYIEAQSGTVPESIRLEENNVVFEAPLAEGQKTGWFYDHRMNRARLADYAAGKRVLDVFSYVGGWGVQAAVMGADSVLCLDASALALSYVENNAQLNGVTDRVTTLEADAFQGMKNLLDSGERFDMVIVDPPAFIPRRRDIKSGEQAYSRLNQLAIRLLDKEGLLVSASCSMHLQRDRLVDILRSAGRQVDRFVQIVEQGHQGPDHPVLPAIPETDYLKSISVRVLPTF